MQPSDINIDPAKRSGQPCIRDTRLTVKDVLEYLAGGMTEAEVIADFPYLKREDFLAVYSWAARAVKIAPTEKMMGFDS